MVIESDPRSAVAPNVYPFAVTHRSVLVIAVPMTLAYLSTPLLGIVDTAVIGQLGSAALIGGVGLAGIVFDLVFATFNFLRTGTTGLTAQAVGARDAGERIAVMFRAVVIAIATGIGLIVLQDPIMTGAQLFLGGSDGVQEATRTYFGIRVYSAPFALVNYAILGWILGLGRAAIGLLLQTLLNGLNIVLSIVFVLVLDWNITGVALATVISEIATTIFGVIAVFVLARKTRMPDVGTVLNGHKIRRMLHLNRDIMIRSFSLLFAFAFFAASSADQGDTVLAANIILKKLLILGAYFLDGMATAAEQLAGRAVGARYRPAFDRTVTLTLTWGFALSTVIAATLWFGGEALIAVMTTSEDVRRTASHYLIWAAMGPLTGVLAYGMDGIFLGATWSRDLRNMMIISLVLYLAAYWLAFPIFGNHGLWAALLVFLGIRGITLAWLCRRRADATFATAPAGSD